MWLIITGAVCLVIGFLAGKFDAIRRISMWREQLPEDYRDIVDGAFKNYPLKPH